MSIESAIFRRLSNHAGLSLLISLRIYPVIAPQNVDVPFLTYQRVSGEVESLLTSDTDVRRDRWQITCFNDDYLGLVSVTSEIKEVLTRWKGIESGTVIEDSFLDIEVDSYDNSTLLFQRTVDFEIIYRT